MTEQKSMWKDKRGVLESLGELGNGVMYVVMILAIGVLIMASMRTPVGGTSNPNTTSNASLVIDAGINASQGLGGWVPVVIIVGVAAVLIGLVSMLRARQ